jgi:hypothetical protein
MSNTIDRSADLHYAFQWGQEAARCGSIETTSAEFIAQFGSADSEAQKAFDAGISYELTRAAIHHT